MVFPEKISVLYGNFIVIGKYFSVKKLWNYLKLCVSYCYSRLGKVTKFALMPAFVSVEPVDYCNLRCPQCPVGLGVRKETRGNEMDFELFKRIIKETHKTLFHVIFYFQGEPTLSVSLLSMIKYAHNHRIFTSTSTNAQVLTNDLAKELVKSGLDKLIVSIDGTTQESYAAYRVGGKLEKAIAGVENIVKWKKNLSSKTPFVEIQCLLLQSNENERDAMKKLAKKLDADRLVFKTAQFYDFEKGNPLMPASEAESRYRKDEATGKYAIKNPLRNHCWRLWTGAVVNAKGDVLPCCYDKNNEFCFGNISKEYFEETWNGDLARSFRKKIIDNRKQFEMCRNCTE
jgi:radical SAM protein with 4Fe4S-binding SPASM domain